MNAESRAATTVIGTTAAAAIAQVGFAIYRARIQQLTPTIGIVTAFLLLLPVAAELSRENRYVYVFWSTFGWLMIVGGLLAIPFRSPVLGLLVQASVPAFLLSFGGLVITPRGWVKARIALLVLFLVSFAGMQLYATLEAFETRDLRNQGITAHWH